MRSEFLRRVTIQVLSLMKIPEKPAFKDAEHYSTLFSSETDYSVSTSSYWPDFFMESSRWKPVDCGKTFPWWLKLPSYRRKSIYSSGILGRFTQGPCSSPVFFKNGFLVQAGSWCHGHSSVLYKPYSMYSVYSISAIWYWWEPKYERLRVCVSIK